MFKMATRAILRFRPRQTHDPAGGPTPPPGSHQLRLHRPVRVPRNCPGSPSDARYQATDLVLTPRPCRRCPMSAAIHSHPFPALPTLPMRHRHRAHLQSAGSRKLRVSSRTRVRPPRRATPLSESPQSASLPRPKTASAGRAQINRRARTSLSAITRRRRRVSTLHSRRSG